MQSEDHQYQTLKTAKTFVSTMQSAFNKKDGDKLAKELKDLYQNKSYKNVPEKSWHVSIHTHQFHDSQSNMGASYAKMLELIRDFAMERAAKKWAESF